MRNSSTSDLDQAAGSLGGLLKQARLVWRLLHDGRISGWVKLIPVAGLVYLVSPIDLFPDIMVPGLSQLDDLAVILLSLKMLTGRGRETRAAGNPPSDAYIEVPYRVLDREEE
jgi:uncharacterized membrane protein YkvA (DUF1232 family)